LVGHIYSIIAYEADLNTIVPSLLKQWKRLEVGLDTSTKAYKALSEHFKHRTKQWLKEDTAAQENRQNTPSSMDIYDSVKQKGVDTEHE
jgi:hypothetical protein